MLLAGSFLVCSETTSVNCVLKSTGSVSAGEVVAIVLVTAAVLGLIPAFIAQHKGRLFGVWWLYGFALFIVAFIHSLVIRPTESAERQHKAEAGLLTCPFCAEMIRPEAIVCRFCGRDLPAPDPLKVEGRVDVSSMSRAEIGARAKAAARRGDPGAPTPGGAGIK